MTSKLTIGEFLNIVRKFHAETVMITGFECDVYGRYESCTVRFRSDNGHNLEVRGVPFTYRGPANTTPEYARSYGNWYELLSALRMLPKSAELSFVQEYAGDCFADSQGMPVIGRTQLVATKSSPKGPEQAKLVFDYRQHTVTENAPDGTLRYVARTFRESYGKV